MDMPQTLEGRYAIEIVGHFGKEDATHLKFVSDQLVYLRKEVTLGHVHEVEARASTILWYFVGKPDIEEFGWILERLLRLLREIGAPLPDLPSSKAWLSAKAGSGLDENHPKVARGLEILRKKEAGEITIEEHKEFVLLNEELLIAHGKRTQNVALVSSGDDAQVRKNLGISRKDFNAAGLLASEILYHFTGKRAIDIKTGQGNPDFSWIAERLIKLLRESE